MSLILHSIVANSAINTAKEFEGGSISSREDERLEMYSIFCFGIGLAIMYISEMGADSLFLDCVYLIFYSICHLAVASIWWDDKQPIKAKRHSLILSAILVSVMLIPFALDMNYTIHVHEVVGFWTWGPIYRDYIDYNQILCIGLTYMWILWHIYWPIKRLYKKDF